MIRGFVLLTVLLAVVAAAPAARAQEAVPAVAGIRVEGLVHLEARFILSKVESKEGDILSSELVREDLRRIGETEGVHSVEVLKEDIEGGVELVFRIEEWPVLRGVTVNGADVLGRSHVEEVLALPAMRFFEEHVLEDDLRRVRALYRERGFSSVKVDHKLETHDGNAVSVTIGIQEGARAVIGDIRIDGLEPGDEKALLGIMETRKSWLLKKHVLDPDVFEDDLERIAAFCRGKGYLDARVVDHKFDIDEKARRMAVRIKVDTGERYLTGDILFEGPFRVVSREVLEGLIKLKEGVPYSPQQLARDRKAITDAYYKRGYIFVAVDSVPSIDREARKVAIRHQVREGVIARVERVDIIGNTKTRDKVIRRELRLRPGDVFDVDKLRRSRDNLWRTRYFDDVSFDILPGSADDLKRIAFQVEEGRTGNVLFGGGYNTVDGMFGRIEMDVLNFDITNPTGSFSGGGQKLHLVAEGGSERRYFDLSFDEPWFRDQPRTLGFDIYDRMRFWDYYEQERMGVRPRYGWHLGEYTRATLSYRYEEAEVRDIGPDASPEIAAEEDSYTTSRFQLVIARDDIILDRMFFPHKGSSKKLVMELADSALGSDKEFTSYIGEVKWYWPVRDPLVLAANVEAGMVDEYGDTERVPILERFFTGGPGSVRGYRYRTVGPKDENNEPLGGRYMLVGSLELTYPVTDTIRAAVFTDTGQVWEEQDDIKLSNIRSSVGLGVRVKIPGSPMSFQVDWAWALDREAGDDSGEMSFGMRAF